MAVTVTSANTNNINYGSRAVVRNSSGIPYVILIDESQGTGGAVEVWKGNGTTPTSFTEQDTSNRPDVAGNETVRGISAAIDSSNIIHIAYYDVSNQKVYYSTFNTSTDSYSTIDEVTGATTGVSTEYSISLALDSNDIPHVGYIRVTKNMGTNYHSVSYVNRIGGSWSSFTEVDGANNSRQTKYVSLSINSSNIPIVSYWNDTNDAARAAVGNANNATSFTLVNLYDTDATNYTTKAGTTSILETPDGDIFSAHVASNGNTLVYRLPSGNTFGTANDWEVSSYDSETDFEDPSLSVSGNNVYLFTEDGNNDDIVYFKYDNTSGWDASHTDLATGTYSMVRSRFGFWVDNDSGGAIVTSQSPYTRTTSDEVDFVYISGTNIVFDSLNTNPAVNVTVNPSVQTVTSSQPAPSVSTNLITFIASATNGATSGTAVSVTKPSGLQNDDVVIAVVHANGPQNVSDNNGSAAFTSALANREFNGPSAQYDIFYRVIDGTEGSTFNFTMDGSNRWCIIVSVYRNVDTTSVFDVTPSASTEAINNTSTTHTMTTATTSSANTKVVAIAANDSNTVSFTATPSGYSARENNSGEQLLALVDKPAATAGSYGGESWTLSAANGDNVSNIFALKLAGGSTNVTVNAAVQTITSSQPTDTVTTTSNVTISPSVQTITSSQPTIGVAIGDGATVSALTINVQQPVPTVTAVKNVSYNATINQLTTSQPAISVDAQKNVTISTTVQTITSSQPTATVTTSSSVTINANVQTITSSQPSIGVLIGDGASPSAATITLSQPAITVTAIKNVSLSPAVQTITSSQPTATVVTGIIISPNVLTVTSSQPTPTVTAIKNVSISAAVQTITSSQPTPSITAVKNVSLSPSVQTITSSQPTPTVSVGDGASVPALTATLSQPAITVTAVKNVSISASVQTVTSSQPTPTVTTSGDVTVTPAVQTITSSQPTATVSTTSSVSLSPAVQTINGSQPSPTISVGDGATPPAQTLALSQPAITVTAVQNVTISAGVQTVTSSQPIATVSTSNDVTLSPAVLTVTSSQPTPAVTAIQNVSIAPAVQTITSSQPAITVDTGADITITPAVLTVTSSQPAISLSLDCVISVAVLQMGARKIIYDTEGNAYWRISDKIYQRI